MGTELHAGSRRKGLVVYSLLMAPASSTFFSIRQDDLFRLLFGCRNVVSLTTSHSPLRLSSEVTARWQNDSSANRQSALSLP